MAIALMEFYRDHGALHHFKPIGFYAAHHLFPDHRGLLLRVDGCQGRASGSRDRRQKTQQARSLSAALHGTINPRDAVNSVYYASAAFVCALVTEGLQMGIPGSRPSALNVRNT